jgi:hypothetical protein
MDILKRMIILFLLIDSKLAARAESQRTITKLNMSCKRME